MKWQSDLTGRLPVKSWCENIEDSAMVQIENLAEHSALFSHIAIMPDCHCGYGMPIGGVAASEKSVIPNAVGVDIGCGMEAVETNLSRSVFRNKALIRQLLGLVKEKIPVGEGHGHSAEQSWRGFDLYLKSVTEKPGWYTPHTWSLAKKNLGTLGGGNHFIELQCDETGKIWLMLHSGSRNLGYRIAEYYNNLAKTGSERDDDLAFLNVSSPEGRDYVRDMTFALDYAAENRQRMMNVFKEALRSLFSQADFIREINIHHNYASLETHFGKEVWVHRKGATSARKDELGIIPGSMGTSSYIVRGLGNPDSFMSCSHGAGRVLSRMKACRELSVEESNRAMGDVVFDRWHRLKRKKGKKESLFDLGESPLAYKNIDEVIKSEMDLIEPVVRLEPLGVIKG